MHSLRPADPPRICLMPLGTTRSTNDFLRGYRPPQPPHMVVATAEFQQAGRGQQGNTWESEAGKNLLFSLLLHPEGLPPRLLFALSEAIALSIRDAASQLAPAAGLTVKWPNDIYAGGNKLAGILMENELAGPHVRRCIIGCGVNVNQRRFESDAPNPVSLCQLTGHDVERRPLLDAILAAFLARYDRLLQSIADLPEGQGPCPAGNDPQSAGIGGQSGGYPAMLHARYLACLYRRQGFHTFRDLRPAPPRPGAGATFEAEIACVEPGGHLVLRDRQGRCTRFAFKEVAYC